MTTAIPERRLIPENFTSCSFIKSEQEHPYIFSRPDSGLKHGLNRGKTGLKHKKRVVGCSAIVLFIY